MKTSHTRALPKTSNRVTHTRKPVQHATKRSRVTSSKASIENKVAGMANHKKVLAERREKNKADRAAAKESYLAAELAKKAKTAHENPPESKEIRSAFNRRMALLHALDLPRTQTQKLNTKFQELVDSNEDFTRHEVSIALTTMSIQGATNYKAASVLLQRLIDGNHVPERSVFYSLARLYEHSGHYKAATTVIQQVNKLYPNESYDDLGFPLPKVVDTASLPNFAELANTSHVDRSQYQSIIDDITLYTNELHNDSIHRGKRIRYSTEHDLLRASLLVKNTPLVSKQFFHIMHRINLAPTETPPDQYSPVDVTPFRSRSKKSSEYNPDYPLYYNVANYFIGAGLWSPAMQTLVYLRALNRHVDQTAMREKTPLGIWRDYLDVHAQHPAHVHNVIKHIAAELTVRRGYHNAMTKMVESNTPTDHIVTENADIRGTHLNYSNIVSTACEDLVILTDRSYNWRDVVKEKGGMEKTNLAAVERMLNVLGIPYTTSLRGSKLSSNRMVARHYVDREALPDNIDPDFETKTDTATGEILPYGDRAPRDLTLTITSKDLEEWGNKQSQNAQEWFNSSAIGVRNIHAIQPRAFGAAGVIVREKVMEAREALETLPAPDALVALEAPVVCTDYVAPRSYDRFTKEDKGNFKDMRFVPDKREVFDGPINQLGAVDTYKDLY